ncbi:hypothetical protein TNCV_2370481 [Trichonephila clavipes]|nr:hypothetical protein TNCV_2370481 [Trichonephila clavipes]
MKCVCLQHDKHPHRQSDDVRNTTDCLHGDHYCGFPGHFITKRHDDSGEPNVKTGYRRGLVVSSSPVSTCNILNKI